jgi:hypothetical protein
VLNPVDGAWIISSELSAICFNTGYHKVPRAKQEQDIMKTFIATTIVTLSLLASSVSAAPVGHSNYPAWAQKAFVGAGK